MAGDTVVNGNSPMAYKEGERKRKHKHKNKEASSSKKRKQTVESASTSPENPESPFSLKTATLYLPLSPISLSPTHALAALLAEHLSPLLLTYYSPLKGIVLAYSNASISSHRPTYPPRRLSDLNPQPLTLAKSADEYGVLYVYLTATFLVFRPSRGQALEGWVNVQSEGFLGAVVYNLFSVGIERNRLPRNWKWVPPGETGENGEVSAAKDTTITDDESSNERAPPVFDAEKEQFLPSALAEDDLDIDAQDAEQTSPGHFQSVSGHRVRGNVRFRVVDVDIVPGTERDRGFLSIEGTMLPPEEEEKLVQAEYQGLSLPPSFAPSSMASNRASLTSDEPPASAMQDSSVMEIESDLGKQSDKKEKRKSEKKKSKSKKEKSKGE